MNVSFHSLASPTAIAVTRDTVCSSNAPSPQSHLMAFSSHEGKREAVGPTSKDSEALQAVHPTELLRGVEETHVGRPPAEELPKRPTACKATPTPNAVATAVFSAAAASYGPLSDGGGAAAAAAAVASLSTFWATVGLTRRLRQGDNASTAHGEGIPSNSSGAHRQRGQQQQHRSCQSTAFASSARSASAEVSGGVQHGGGSRLGRQLSSAPSHSYARSRSFSINPTPLLSRGGGSSSLRTGGQRLRRRAASFAAADSSSSNLSFAPATDGLAASLPILPRRRVSISHGFGEEHFERTRDASLLPYDDPSEALSVSVRLGRSGSRMFMFARMLSPASPTAADTTAAEASHVAAVGSDFLTATSSSSKGDKQNQRRRGDSSNTASGAVRRGSAFPSFVSSVASHAALFARAGAAAARTVFTVGSAAAGGAGAALRFAAHFPAMVGLGLGRMRRGASAAVTAPLDSAAVSTSVSPPPPHGVAVDDEAVGRFYNDSDCDGGDADADGRTLARSDADAAADERGSIRGEEGDDKVDDEFAYRRRLRQQFFSMSPAAVAASPLPANADTTAAALSPPTTSANVVSGTDELAETIPHPAAPASVRSSVSKNNKKKVAPSSFAFSPPTPSSSPTAAAADDTAGMGTLRMTEAERSLLLESPPSRGDDAIVRRVGSLMFVSPSTA